MNLLARILHQPTNKDPETEKIKILLNMMEDPQYRQMKPDWADTQFNKENIEYTGDCWNGMQLLSKEERYTNEEFSLATTGVIFQGKTVDRYSTIKFLNCLRSNVQFSYLENYRGNFSAMWISREEQALYTWVGTREITGKVDYQLYLMLSKKTKIITISENELAMRFLEQQDKTCVVHKLKANTVTRFAPGQPPVLVRNIQRWKTNIKMLQIKDSGADWNSVVEKN